MGQPDYHDSNVEPWSLPRPTRRPHEVVRLERSLGFSPPVMPAPPAWMKDAECREWGELFDVVYDYPSSGRVKACKQVCAACPVVAECLKFAMDMETDDTIYRYGVFGGMSAAERTQARTRHQGNRPRKPA